MKKLTLLLAFLTLTAPTFAQVVTGRAGEIQRVTSAPSGSCGVGQVRDYNGALYTCQSGTWALSGVASVPAATSTVQGKAVLGAKDTTTIAGLGACAAGNAGQSKEVSDGNKGKRTCRNTTGSTYAWVDDDPIFNITRFGAAVTETAANNTTYINAALTAAGMSGGKVTLPCGTFLFDGTLTFAGDNTDFVGQGSCTVLSYTGTGTAITFNGKKYSKIKELSIITTTGGVGISLNFVAHYNKIERVKMDGWLDASIRLTSAFGAQITECDIHNTNIGIDFYSEANGNQVIGNSIREAQTGISLRDVAGLPSNGNTISGNLIEASQVGDLYAIEIAGTASNMIIGNRLEYTVGTAHIKVDAGSGNVARYNNFTNNVIEGTIAAYLIGDSSGSQQAQSTLIIGGRGAGAVTLGTDAFRTKIIAPAGSYGGTLTDNGEESDIDIDSAGGQTYRKYSTNLVYKLLAGGTSTVTDYGVNYSQVNFTGLTDAFRFSRINVAGTETAVSRHGAYRFWVNPGTGNFHKHTADPTAITDGGFFLTNNGTETISGAKTFSTSPTLSGGVNFNFNNSTISSPASGSWVFTPGAASDGDMFFNLATGKTLFAPTGAKLGLASTSYRWELYASTGDFTSASANALVVGANGATNPALQVDANTASVATGIKITGAAAGSGVSLAAISSGTNEALNLSGKGTGNVKIDASSLALTNATVTATSGGTTTLDLSLGNIRTITMPAGNTTIALSNIPVGFISLAIIQDSVGGRTITWPSTIKNGTITMDLQPSPTATYRTQFGFQCDGTNCYLESSNYDGVSYQYVDLANNQTIAGVKTFNSGIKIGGSATISNYLTGSATLDFANQVAAGCEVLTITVTGAADGDTVFIGVPNASNTTNSTFYGWVSGADTVSVKHCAIISGNPASGTFKATVFK